MLTESRGLLSESLAGRQIYHMPLNATVDPDPTVFWMQFNGFQYARDGMNSSTMLSDQRSASQADSIVVADFVVLGISLTLLVAISSLFMVSQSAVES